MCLIHCLAHSRHYINVYALSRFSCVRLFAPLWSIALRAPLSMGFSRQEYLSWLSFPTPGDLPNPGIELASPALAGRFFTTELPGKPRVTGHVLNF